MFSVVLLHSLLVLSSCSELHDKVFRNLLRLCPEQYVSTDNGTAVNHTSESGSCCTDFFSERTVYSNRTKYMGDGQSCLYPTTHPDVLNIQARKSYFMVTDAPEDGCVIPDKSTTGLANDNNQPTCNDSELIPFRRFLPVYSKSSGFIYKNPQCAYCHGQYELTDWKARASCPLNNPFQYDLNNCKFQFLYTGLVDDIQDLECFTETFNRCPDQFDADVNIPSNIDLSVQELAEACTMDELPRFEYSYFSKNVFCYICHYCRRHRTCPFTECLPPPDPVSRGGSNEEFARILDFRVIDQNTHVSHQDETVCGLELDAKICHVVMCPKGQVMTGDGRSKKCRMDSTRWIAKNSKFVMWLFLDFHHNMPVNDDALEKVLTQNRVQNPWPASWNMETFYRPFARNIDMAYADGGSRNMSKVHIVDLFSHAYLQMSYKKNSVNPDIFVSDVEKAISKTMSFKIDNTLYRARQAFSKYTLIETKKGEQELKGFLRYGVPFWHLSPDFNPQERILYKAIVKGQMPRGTADISRLLFCRQVELPSTHFMVFDSNTDRRVALYYNRTGKYIFDKEFTEVITPTNDRKYRICISDTEIKSAAGRGKCTTWLLAAVFCMLLV